MSSVSKTRARTGIEGLDNVLNGGLVANRLYLVEGMPGSGKTTLAFQFLMEGARRGEPVLYVTLSESEEEIREVAASHGWSLEGVSIRELIPPENTLDPGEEYTVFHPSEVELSETTRKILKDVENTKARRIVFDSLSELRLLAGNPLRYRRQILALKQYFSGRQCTVLLLDDMTSADHDLQVQSISHGALLLEHSNPSFGGTRRRLHVTKFRGSDFRNGFHDYEIRRGGIEVFPRLVAAEHRQEPSRERLKSGLEPLDVLLGGGLERGTSTLIQGAAGTGKSTIAALFAAKAAERGEHSMLLIFDESVPTLFSRMNGLGVNLKTHVESGKMAIRQVDPAELSPGEMAEIIRRTVTEKRSRIVIVDSLNGYLNSMPDGKFLIVQMHEVLTYLGQQGVASILIAAHHGMVSAHMSSPVDMSYLADTVLLMRYFEAEGEVRQVISVVKMRGGAHERSIRELRMKDGRIHLSEPMRNYRGVLTGTPQKNSEL